MTETFPCLTQMLEHAPLTQLSPCMGGGFWEYCVKISGSNLLLHAIDERSRKEDLSVLKGQMHNVRCHYNKNWRK